MQEAAKGFRRLRLTRNLRCFAKRRPSSLQIIVLPNPQRLHSLLTCSSRFGNFNITRDDTPKARVRDMVWQHTMSEVLGLSAAPAC